MIKRNKALDSKGSDKICQKISYSQPDKGLSNYKLM